MHGITKQILSTIRAKGDFPSISSGVQSIVDSANSTQGEEVPDLTNWVLSDFALTQKVLRLANSGMYAGFGRQISTVSQAIMVLGFDTIHHLALGVKLLDGMSTASTQDKAARKSLAQAVACSEIARTLGEIAANTLRDAEEVSICALLSNLGGLLVSYYLPAKWQKLTEYAAANDATYDGAAKATLGLSLHQLAEEIATAWGLPTKLARVIGESKTSDDNERWVRSVVSVSDNAALALRQGAPADEVIYGILNHAEALGFAPEMALPRLQLLLAKSEAAKTTAEDDTPKGRPPAEQLLMTEASLREQAQTGMPIGVMLSAVLESIHTALSTRRTALLLRDSRSGQFVTHAVIGQQGGSLKQHLKLNCAYSPDIFHVSLARNAPIFIECSKTAEKAGQLPGNYVRAMSDRPPFLVIPLVRGNMKVGMIYADWPPSNQPKPQREEFSALIRLRDLLLEQAPMAA